MRQHIEWMYEITMYLRCLLTYFHDFSVYLISGTWVPNWSISRNYKNIWNSTKYSVTTQMFLTHRPCGAKPQVKGSQGPASRPNPMAIQPHFESIWTGTWWLCSHTGLEEDPMPESKWKTGGVAGRWHGVIPGFYAKIEYSSYACPRIKCSTHTAKRLTDNQMS
jgi:hypothetical protein